MSFSDRQLRALERKVPGRYIRTRTNGGKELSYIEGWYAIAAANRIFGFDGWDRRTVETKCILGREARGTFLAVYSAKVRIAVRVGDDIVIREGHGTGEGRAPFPAEAHDHALKMAETDATKRALATFGSAFGLALYAGNRRPPRPAKRPGSTNGVNGALADDHHRHERSQSEPEAWSAIEEILGADAVTEGSQPAQPSVADQAAQNLGRAGAQSHSPVRGSIDKSALPHGEPHRVRDKDHLRFVASQPCLLCSAVPADAHHLKYAQPRAVGRKASDEFTVPLCRPHHRELHHSGNEAAWWHDMGIDAIEVAAELWRESLATRAGREREHFAANGSLA